MEKIKLKENQCKKHDMLETSLEYPLSCEIKAINKIKTEHKINLK